MRTMDEQLAALQERVTTLQNEIGHHGIEEQGWRDQIARANRRTDKLHEEFERQKLEWKRRERDLLDANTRYLLRSRHSEGLAVALEDILTEARAYQSPEIDDDDSIMAPLFKVADTAIEAYRKENPKKKEDQ